MSMSYRLTKISTCTGDQGTTALADGTRLSKDELRIHALGEIDELNCSIGMLLSMELPDFLAEFLTLSLSRIQNDLFELGSELALPGHVSLTDARVFEMEKTLESLNADLPPLREFILPGGSPAAAVCHFARAVTRRAERSIVTLARNEAVHPIAVRYLNRLSDLLFVMARAINHGAGHSEISWQHGHARDHNHGRN